MMERKHQIKHSYISYATTTMKKLKASHSRVSSAWTAPEWKAKFKKIEEEKKDKTMQ